MLRTLLPGIQPAVETTPVQEVSFAERVQQGDICTGRLAATHGFVVSVSNTEKTEFIVLDSNEAVGEFRSFVWSRDGQQLAMLGNTMGGGSIHVVDSSSNQPQYIVDPSEFGYMYGMAWSRDGEKFVTWSGQDNTKVYLLDAEGNMVKKDLGVQLLGTAQFTPDGTGIVFRGADTQSGGLFEASLEDSQIELISALVEDETGFAFSPDGSHLAYVEMDRTAGEARLVSLDRSTGKKSTLGTLPIPKGSGSSIPELANLSWSPDGRSLAFDIGYGAGDRTIYLAFVDGTTLHKVVDSGYAPTISPDGQCLAFIRNAQVFLLDLTANSGTAIETTPILLADLPTGKVIPNYELDQLGWSPEP
jgi:Tol biopolymer transport system component